MQFHKPREFSGKDAFGERTAVTNSNRRREWQWNPPNDHMGLNLPIYVRHCGNSVWGAGVSIVREKSNIFGLEMVSAGTIEFTQDSRSYLVNPGDVFLLHKGRDHSYRTGPCGFAHKRFICLDGPLLPAMLSQLGLQETDVIKPAEPKAFAGFVKKAGRLCEMRPPGFLKQLSELAFSNLLYMGNEVEGNRYPAAVQAALDYMHQHINRMISLGELSRAARVSIQHLNRLFNQHLHSTPMEFFRSLKIEHACQLLSGTSARIKEIALRIGYEDPTYFSRVFTQITGVSPRKFRKN
jgi:AraC-like DNA-binding protein